jgi:hypothetical protein
VNCVGLTLMLLKWGIIRIDNIIECSIIFELKIILMNIQKLLLIALIGSIISGIDIFSQTTFKRYTILTGIGKPWKT